MLTYFLKIINQNQENMKNLKIFLLVAIPALMMACGQTGSGNENMERSDESGMRGRSYDNDQDTVKQRRSTDQSSQPGRSTTTSPSTGSQTDESGTQSGQSRPQSDQSGSGSTQPGTKSEKSTSPATQRSDTSRTTTPGSSGTGATPR